MARERVAQAFCVSMCLTFLLGVYTIVYSSWLVVGVIPLAALTGGLLVRYGWLTDGL